MQRFIKISGYAECRITLAVLTSMLLAIGTIIEMKLDFGVGPSYLIVIKTLCPYFALKYTLR